MVALDIKAQIATIEMPSAPTVSQILEFNELCFLPKLIIALGVYDLEPSDADPSGTSYGVWCNNKQYCFSVKLERTTGVGGGHDCVRRFDPDLIFVNYESTLVDHDIYWAAHVHEITDHGFSIMMDVADGEDINPGFFVAVCLGGDDLTVDVVNWQMPTDAGEFEVTGIGFTPQAAIHWHALTNQIATTVNSAALGTGFVCTEDAFSIANAFFATDNVTPNVAKRVQRQGDALIGVDGSGTIALEAEHVSFEVGGCTLDFTTPPSAANEVVSIFLSSAHGTWKGLTFGSPASATFPQYEPIPFDGVPYVTFLSSFSAAATDLVINHGCQTFAAITQYAFDTLSPEVFFENISVGIGEIHGSNSVGASAVAFNMNNSAAIQFLWTDPSDTDLTSNTSNDKIANFLPHIDSECTIPPVYDYQWGDSFSISAEIAALYIERTYEELIPEMDVHISELVIEVLTVDSEEPEPEPPEELPCTGIDIARVPVCVEVSTSSSPITRTAVSGTPSFSAIPGCKVLPSASHPVIVCR